MRGKTMFNFIRNTHSPIGLILSIGLLCMFIATGDIFDPSRLEPYGNGTWRSAKAFVLKGGDGSGEIRLINGVVPTTEEARELAAHATRKDIKVHDPHAPGVNEKKRYHDTSTHHGREVRAHWKEHSYDYPHVVYYSWSNEELVTIEVSDHE
jgi:hypothetical protein